MPSKDNDVPMHKKTIFNAMVSNPYPFMILVPVMFIVLIAVGWTRDDFVEDQVGEIWISTKDNLAKNWDYLDSLGTQSFSSTTAAAMAISRDGKNIFTESRLEEVRARMEKVESMTIEHGGVDFAWDDVCLSNSLGSGTCTTYRFPCIRLSPMDHFREARWYFDEPDRLSWYHGVVKAEAIRPRILRFGILQEYCIPPVGSTCAQQALLRTSPEFAVSQGYPDEYANPLGLIADVGDLEFNDPCRMCIEQSLNVAMNSMQQLVQSLFTVIQYEFTKSVALLEGDSEAQAAMASLAAKAENIAASVNREKVEDFFYYQVLRGAYAELGAPAYMAFYGEAVAQAQLLCSSNIPGFVCPPANVSEAEAKAALVRHADNTFSSITTAGAPFPFWSSGDGTGAMFAGSLPVGGSGIDMSAPLGITSAATYFDLANYGTEAWSPQYSAEFANPLTPDTNWTSMVETNPIYAWFMAGETEMTAHCGNGNLTGTNFGDPFVDGLTAGSAVASSQYWCTKFNVPFEKDGTFTKQHFARMWYDLLLDSENFLGITAGEDDPYTWTLGTGCGYSLGGERFSYTGQSEVDILGNASGELYFIDEGASVGAIDSNLLVGGATPPVGSYNYSTPLEEVKVIQAIYPTLGMEADIVERVRNPNRPSGPVEITEEDAIEILRKFKEEFDIVWSEGWDEDSEGDVQFVSFYDDVGAAGTTARFLRDITLSNGKLTAISIAIIALFSVILLFSFDPIDSMVGITLIGVTLVILAFFAALGMAILCGIKINVSVAWTLPFIILGLGVDDMYIVLLALKKETGSSKENFLNAMVEVVGPVSMTSIVNASMFAMLNISDVPAVYLTAQIALIAVIFLYIAIILCFPAFCYLDMERQAAKKRDIFIWQEVKRDNNDGGYQGLSVGTWLITTIYDYFFYPLVLGPPIIRVVTHLFLWGAAIAILVLGIIGINDRQVGLGLEDFFPASNQANRWATVRTEELASWNININWGELEYGNPDVQMQMIKQFEDVISTPNIAEVDTIQLWIASLALWTTRQCDTDVARSEAEVAECGMNQVYPGDFSTCTGTWKRNDYNLREKIFADPTQSCQPYQGGICRPTSQMHPDDLAELGVSLESEPDTVWCPVFEGWSEEKMGFCIKKWRMFTGGGGSLLLEEDYGSPAECPGDYLNDQNVTMPIKFSSGPSMFAIHLTSHDVTVDTIEETRAFCDDNEDLHCWMTGIPYTYWSQYIGIFGVLTEVSVWAVSVGFVVATIILFLMLHLEGFHSMGKNVTGAFIGAFLIAVTTILSLVATIGLSVLLDVKLTGFSLISFVLSVGFSVEYSVHVVSRWLLADNDLKTALERVDYAVSFLMLPTFMSFVSSTIGVACLGFTEFEFTQVFFFRPLIVVMLVTYFYGCWWLPALLTLLDFDVLKLGKPPSHTDDDEEEE